MVECGRRSPPPSGERVGVRGRVAERSPTPTSPSHAFGAGPSLSPLKGGEGLRFSDPAVFRASLSLDTSAVSARVESPKTVMER